MSTKVGKCLLCDNPFDCSTVISPSIQHSRTIFHTCCIYLEEKVAKDSWNESERNPPFCSPCFKFSELLFSMHEQLEEMRREISSFVASYVSSALRAKKSFPMPLLGVNVKANDDSSIHSATPTSPPSSNANNQNDDYCSVIVNDAATESADSILTEPEENEIEIKYEVVTDSDPLGKNVQDPIFPNHPSTSTKVQINSHNFVCDACHDEFPNNYQLQVHNSSHVGILEMLTCDFCGDGFFKCETLLKHQWEHREIGQIPFIDCDRCPLSFYNFDNFLKHQSTHSPPESEYPSSESDPLGKKSYNCSSCSQIFKSHMGLKHHVKTQHNSKCINCGMRFGVGEEYQLHRLSHMYERSSCRICRRIFPSRDHLRQHFMQKHN